MFSGTCSLGISLLYFIRKQENEARKTLKGSSRQNKDLLAISLKIILTLGIIEIIGFVQISKEDLSENEVMFNSTFAVLYTVLRSLRGLFLFMIYVVNKQKLKSIKKIIQMNNKMSKHSQTSNTNL